MRSFSATPTARGSSSLLLWFTLIVGASSCGGGESVAPPPPSGSSPRVGAVVITEPATALGQLRSTRLTATVLSTTGESLTSETLRWSSLDARFASVDSLGVVMPLKPGRARIVATVGSVADTVDLTIHVRWLDLALSSSWSVACGIAADSTAYCWGARVGATDSTSIPLEVPGGHHFRAIAAAANAACAIDGASRVFCWGANGWGQLGDGSRDNSSVPVLVNGVADAELIATGDGYACASTTSGTIYCWGHDDFGQIGDGTSNSDDVRPPTRVDGVPRPSKLALGTMHACALGVDGSAYCWGLSQWGTLGAATTQYASTPLRVGGTMSFRDIAASTYVSCGAASTGGVYCWGLYGGNTSTPQLQPGTESLTAIAVSSVSGAHLCGLGPTGASCWISAGSLTYGPPTSTSIAGSQSYVRIRAAEVAACALTPDGEAFCWGENLAGVLGNGTFVNSATPTLVADPLT
ncbi:MAG TPA: Ig-like domain-containing protein [Gemmatimonadaceae bacterium]